MTLSLALLLCSPASAAETDSAKANEPPPIPMRPWGQLQIFTTVFDQDESVQADAASYGDPEADPGFAIARARFGFAGALSVRSFDSAVVDYGLSLGINTPYDALGPPERRVTMVDAFGRITFEPSLGDTSFALGLVKVPFSREALMSSQDLVFMERAVGAESLTSVRDVGLLARQEANLGDDDDAPVAALSVGVFNGNNDFLGDDDPGIMAAARVELEKGETWRTWGPDGGVAYGVGASALLNDELALRTTAFSGDGYLRIGPWSLMGEVGLASLDPTDSTVAAPEVFVTTNRLSWTVNTSVFAKVGNATRFEVPGIEFAVRASALDDNRSLQDNGDVLIVHAGATARSFLPYLDFGLGFIHREELQGRALPNDTIRIWTQLRPRGADRLPVDVPRGTSAFREAEED
jgi:hypothetical protein